MTLSFSLSGPSRTSPGRERTGWLGHATPLVVFDEEPVDVFVHGFERYAPAGADFD